MGQNWKTLTSFSMFLGLGVVRVRLGFGACRVIFVVYLGLGGFLVQNCFFYFVALNYFAVDGMR